MSRNCLFFRIAKVAARRQRASRNAKKAAATERGEILKFGKNGTGLNFGARSPKRSLKIKKKVGRRLSSTAVPPSTAGSLGENEFR